MGPKLEKVGPQLEKVGPKLKKVGPKLEKMGPKLEKSGSKKYFFLLVSAGNLYQKWARKKPAKPNQEYLSSGIR